MAADPNWDRIRDRIDSGSTGDKIAAPDPAAAPLGTDEEAGGLTTPPSALARSAEIQAAAAALATEDRPARQPKWILSIAGVGLLALVGSLVAVALVLAP